MTVAGLTLDRVAAVRGGRRLFADLTLTLAPGDATLVTGPNGAGKSTLLRIAAGLLVPADGVVAHEGQRAWLGEQAALDPDRPLATALAFWAALDPVADPWRRVAAALDRAGLDALAEVPVRYLSTGQRRRAAMACVVASAAPIWLLDEPANGLDEASVERLTATIAEHRAGGGIVVVATHLLIALPDAQSIVLGAGA